jgi:hypothetical protein
VIPTFLKLTAGIIWCSIFWRKENVSNLCSRKSILFVEPIFMEQKETTRKTKLTTYETTFNVSE